LVVLLKLGVKGAVIAAIITPGICSILYVILLRSEARIRFGCNKNALKDSIAFGVQVHLGNVLQFLNYRLDVFVVNHFAGVANVGFYAVAASLAEIIWFLPDAFGFVLFPKTASSDPEVAKQFTPKVARLSALITAVAALGLFLVSKPMITAMYTKAYLPALYPLWILLPGTVALSYSKVIFSDLGGRGKPYYSVWASVFSFIMTLGFDLLLIPRLGIIGAAIASSLAYTTNAVMAVAFYVRLTGNKLTDVLLVQKDDIETSLGIGREMIRVVGRMLSV
jgi:O-antigen/teichoic acid export membrane protein